MPGMWTPARQRMRRLHPRMGRRVKALTLWQPWASLVALGVKTIETRSWSTKYRGPLAIHAAVRKPPRVWTQDDGYAPPAADIIGMGRHWESFEDRYQPGQFGYDWVGPLGAVVATCTLVDVLPIHEQLCNCGLRSTYVGIGTGGLGREILGVYAGHDAERPGLAFSRVNGNLDGHPWVAAVGDEERIIDQIPYGDFRCGRFAWLLADIDPLAEPVPAKGHQGLWDWTPPCHGWDAA